MCFWGVEKKKCIQQQQHHKPYKKHYNHEEKKYETARHMMYDLSVEKYIPWMR